MRRSRLGDALLLACGECRGGREDGGNVLEARYARAAPLVLRRRRAPARTGSYRQDTDAGRAAPLVGAAGQHVPAGRRVEPPQRLRRVHVQRDAQLRASGGDGVDGLQRADLVVRALQIRDRDAAGPGGVGERVDVDPAEAVDGDEAHLARACPDGRRGRVEHARVLDGGRDHVRTDAPPSERAAQHGEVNGRRAGGRKRDLVRAGAQQAGDLLAGGLVRGAGPAGAAVQARRVGPAGVERRQQRVERGGVQRRRRRPVEVGAGRAGSRDGVGHPAIAHPAAPRSCGDPRLLPEDTPRLVDTRPPRGAPQQDSGNALR